MSVRSWRIDHVLQHEQGAVLRGPLAAALGDDDDLVAGVGHSVAGDIIEDHCSEHTEPLLDIAVGCDHEAGSPASREDLLAEVDQLLMVEPVRAGFVEVPQIGREEAAGGLADRVVNANLGQLAGVAVGRRARQHGRPPRRRRITNYASLEVARP